MGANVKTEMFEKYENEKAIENGYDSLFDIYTE